MYSYLTNPLFYFGSMLFSLLGLCLFYLLSHSYNTFSHSILRSIISVRLGRPWWISKHFTSKCFILTYFINMSVFVTEVENRQLNITHFQHLYAVPHLYNEHEGNNGMKNVPFDTWLYEKTLSSCLMSYRDTKNRSRWWHNSPFPSR